MSYTYGASVASDTIDIVGKTCQRHLVDSEIKGHYDNCTKGAMFPQPRLAYK